MPATSIAKCTHFSLAVDDWSTIWADIALCVIEPSTSIAALASTAVRLRLIGTALTALLPDLVDASSDELEELALDRGFVASGTPCSDRSGDRSREEMGGGGLHEDPRC